MSIADEGQKRRNEQATIYCRHCLMDFTDHAGTELWCLFSPTRFEPMTVAEWNTHRYGYRSLRNA